MEDRAGEDSAEAHLDVTLAGEPLGCSFFGHEGVEDGAVACVFRG
jgi:hypothetical protein